MPLPISKPVFVVAGVVLLLAIAYLMYAHSQLLRPATAEVEKTCLNEAYPKDKPGMSSAPPPDLVFSHYNECLNRHLMASETMDDFLSKLANR